MEEETILIEASTAPDIGELKKQYNNFSANKAEEIEEMREARKYYHGVQWTGHEIKVMKERNQPVVTYNRIAPKINGIVGVLEARRQDAKAYPRTPQQEQGAELATQIIRYALDQAQWPEVEAECLRQASICGVGVCALTLEQGDHGDPEVGLEVIDTDQFFYDDRSYRADFSDCMFMGVAKWLDLDIARSLFPEADVDLTNLVNQGQMDNWQQYEREKSWVNTDKKRLFVVEQWYKEKRKWKYCFYASGLLLGFGESPFYDKKSQSISRFKAFSSFVDQDGDRYGFVRNLKSPQQEVNRRRSKSLHILGTNQIFMRKDDAADKNAVRKELARPDGIIEYELDKPELNTMLKGMDMQGHFQLLEEAKAEIMNFGPNPALLGDAKNQSGRAIALLQQSGLAELGPFIRTYRNWKQDVYETVFSTVQRYWQAERYIRVTDDQELTQFLQINQLSFDDYGQPIIVNPLGSLDVDIIMDESGDTVNTMADTFDLLGQLASAGIPVPPQVVIELSSLPFSVKSKVISMLEAASQQQVDPMLQRAQEVEIAKTEAEVGATQAKGLKDFAQAAQTLITPIPQELVDSPEQQPMQVPPQEAMSAPQPF